MSYTIRYLNLDGLGDRPVRVFRMAPRPIMSDGRPVPGVWDYWGAITDVPCPREGCDGLLVWAENGYVPGYRICDGCGAHFEGRGTAQSPEVAMARPAGTRTGLTIEILASGHTRRQAK